MEEIWNIKRFDIIGVDYSKKLVELVNKKFNDKKAFHADMVELPFKDNFLIIFYALLFIII